MVPEKFRRQLRQEAEKWWSEGLIDAALYEKLSEQYQFEQLEQEASNRFIVILMGLGAILLGLGAITFVAANWQEWSRSFKVMLLLSCFIGVNAAGFYFWRNPDSRKGYQRLGHGLLLLGAMLLGANIGLMSQMFHQNGQLYELLLIWGLGVAAMAYSLRLTSLGVVSLILVSMGYLWGWFEWSNWQEFSGTRLVVQHLPLVVSLVFVPLAYWCRSRVIFGLSAIAVAFSLVFNLQPLTLWSGSLFESGWMIAIAFVLPPALLWGYSDRIWQRLPYTPHSAPHTPPDPFQPISRSLAIWFLGILFYLFAFHWWWEKSFGNSFRALDRWNWTVLIDVALLGIVAGLGWLQIGRQFKQARQFQEKAVNSGAIAGLLIITTLVLLRHIEHGPITVIATLAFNLMLFLLALGLMRDGLAQASRQTFWGGIVLLVLGIISRMLEYDTALLLKAIVFALCGVGIIIAGLWFERNVDRQKVSSAEN